MEILTVKNLITLTVDDFTLFVHNIVVLEDILTNAKVTKLNLFL